VSRPARRAENAKGARGGPAGAEIATGAELVRRVALVDGPIDEAAGGIVDHARIRVCFRFDDPSARSDHDLEARVLDVFAGFGVKLTVAVVPFGRDGDALRPLRRTDVPHLTAAHGEGRIEVALHGYCHEANSRDRSGIPSEFRTVPLELQRQRLADGRQVLQQAFDTEVSGFVPPWNTYDATTVEATKRLGFGYFSAGLGTGSAGSQPVLIPKTSSLRAGEAGHAIGSATRFRFCAPVVVFVFHPDQFVEFRSPPARGEPPPFLSLDALRSFLRRLADEVEQVEVVTLAELAEDLGARTRLWCAQDFDRFGRVSHRLRQRLPSGFFSTRPKWFILPGLGHAVA
jgi:peptidoglycan/xylan/chitin deacetylase (PgdA/CDA1 family)